MKWRKWAQTPDEGKAAPTSDQRSCEEGSAVRGQTDMGVIRRHFVISGRVQGVGFRYTAYQVANAYGLTGWVRNCDDGTVEMELQGPEGLVSTFLKRLQLKNKWMRMEHVEENDIPVINEENFHERY